MNDSEFSYWTATFIMGWKCLDIYHDYSVWLMRDSGEVDVTKWHPSLDLNDMRRVEMELRALSFRAKKPMWFRTHYIRTLTLLKTREPLIETETALSIAWQACTATVEDRMKAIISLKDEIIEMVNEANKNTQVENEN